MTRREHLGREAPNYDVVATMVEMTLKENFVAAPPVSPLEIAANYGIKVFFAEFPESQDSVSGFFNFSANDIYVNRDDPPQRQTFTIAHELGHARLHRDYFLQCPDDYRVLLRTPIGAVTDALEMEANAFAAQLLVPKGMLAKYSKIGSLGELVRLFNVSEEVIRFRLAHEPSYEKI